VDSQVVNKLSATYAERSLRLTPALFDLLGIVKKGTQLRIEEFYVSCIPFDLSLTQASLLAFLSPREVEFFDKFKDKPHKFYLTVVTQFSKKPQSFFVPCRIAAFRKNDEASQYCFIDVAFFNVPLLLRELLVGYFLEADEAERFFEQAPDLPFSEEQIRKAFGALHLRQFGSDGTSANSLRIVAVTPKRLRLFGEIPGKLPAPGSVLEFEVEAEAEEHQAAPVLKGAVASSAPSAEAPGFASIELNLAFSPSLHSRLRSAAGWKSSSK